MNMFLGFKPKDGRFHIELGKNEVGKSQFIWRFYLLEVIIVLVIVGILIGCAWSSCPNLSKWE